MHADRFEARIAVVGLIDGSDSDRVQQRTGHLAHGALVIDDQHLQPDKLCRDLAFDRFHDASRSGRRHVTSYR